MAANDIFKEKPEKIIASGVMLDTGINALANFSGGSRNWIAGSQSGKAKQTRNLRGHLWGSPFLPSLKMRCCTVMFRKFSPLPFFRIDLCKFLNAFLFESLKFNEHFLYEMQNIDTIFIIKLSGIN